MSQPMLLMGNEAIAYGAIDAGVSFVSGYPGTPSTEALETVARIKPSGVHVEWSVNEKVALEVAAGASYAGTRVLVTMKQVGLNVASDPLMSLNYVGVKGGFVLLVADDPGPISSQTEQDTRRFAQFARLPVLDPTSPEEAYAMTRFAFELSERFRVPVIIRPTTRVCHSCAAVERAEPLGLVKPTGFVKSADWVIFPRLSYQAKGRLVGREPELADAQSQFNTIEELGNASESATLGIAGGGIGAAYAREAVQRLGIRCRMLTVSAPNPFPEAIAMQFLDGLTDVLVVEELDPVIEDGLRPLCDVSILHGKRDGTVAVRGELSAPAVEQAIAAFVPNPGGGWEGDVNPLPKGADATPPRPPILCAGCPHRASFYAVKRAAQGVKSIFCGDIGCYTLGNAPPLNMVDTCLCMGAGVTIAQGLSRAEADATCFAFIGDSTFFHSGMTGVLNAVYNQSNVIVVVLDNRTTGMTGRQPHPGTGESALGEPAPQVDIEAILRALGVHSIRKCSPFELDEAIEIVQSAMDESGVRAIIFEAPCIAVSKPGKPMVVNESECVGCQVCVKAIGCPALSMRNRRAVIDASLCTGCGLCAQICPREAIIGV
ncbi:indolepyruvate ferredoxin oxidoreductase subunit alpha [Clostridia bacterium]|nr:indolepyruvate ferredoxin oxidoreductase subunit alpha [Clostridia bacterium]